MTAILLAVWISFSFGFIWGWAVRSLRFHSRKQEKPFRG